MNENNPGNARVMSTAEVVGKLDISDLLETTRPAMSRLVKSFLDDSVLEGIAEIESNLDEGADIVSSTAYFVYRNLVGNAVPDAAKERLTAIYEKIKADYGIDLKNDPSKYGFKEPSLYDDGGIMADGFGAKIKRRK